ncbi:MAG: hypothetical protein CMM50_18700 [Rhodospirillaceae bacterium]|mgnify:CR=1 FL=1|nr:hypothetical protein [Rhodospirillaceae bacterium]
MSLWKRIRPVALAIAGGVFLAPAASADDFDLAAAREVYLHECFKCHGKIEADVALSRENLLQPAVALPYGPTLLGVYGRPAGTIEDFKYSRAFEEKAPEIVWTGEMLDKWLAGTQDVIQGTVMFYKQKNADIRATVIAYLKATTEMAKNK